MFVRSGNLVCFLCIFGFAAESQQSSAPAGQLIPKPAGLESAWTVRSILDDLLEGQ